MTCGDCDEPIPTSSFHIVECNSTIAIVRIRSKLVESRVTYPSKNSLGKRVGAFITGCCQFFLP